MRRGVWRHAGRRAAFLLAPRLERVVQGKLGTPAERAAIPHAELLSLWALAQKGGVDLAAASARLTARGLTGFTPETIVREIAEHAKLSAQQVPESFVTTTP